MKSSSADTLTTFTFSRPATRWAVPIRLRLKTCCGRLWKNIMDGKSLPEAYRSFGEMLKRRGSPEADKFLRYHALTREYQKGLPGLRQSHRRGAFKRRKEENFRRVLQSIPAILPAVPGISRKKSGRPLCAGCARRGHPVRVCTHTGASHRKGVGNPSARLRPKTLTSVWLASKSKSMPIRPRLKNCCARLRRKIPTVMRGGSLPGGWGKC